MNLPLQNPPFGWTVSQSQHCVQIEKTPPQNIDNRHVVAAAVAGVCPLLFETFMQSVVQGMPLADVVLRWRTLQLSLFLPVFVGLAVLARNYLGSRTILALTPEEFTVRFGYGNHDRLTVPRNRVRALVRYVEQSTVEEGRLPVAVVLEWLKPGGEDSGFSLGTVAARPEELQWLIRVLEAWSGKQLRTETCRDVEESEEESGIQ